MDELFMFSKAVRSGEKVELYVYSQSIKCGHERGYDIVRRDKTVVCRLSLCATVSIGEGVILDGCNYNGIFKRAVLAHQRHYFFDWQHVVDDLGGGPHRVRHFGRAARYF
jgi:hypothetical protein